MSELGFDLRRLAIPAYGPTLLFGAAEGAILPVIPSTAVARGASVALAAFVAMLIGLGSLVSNIPASLITQRLGERRALVLAGVVTAAGCLLCLAPSLVALMLGVVIIGMASSVYMLARQKYLTEAVPPTHRARALSLLGGVGRIGMFVGPLVGAALIGVFGGRSVFVLAIVFLALATWCALLMEDVERAGTGPVERVSTRTVARSFARVLLTVGLGVLLVSAVRATRQVVIPLWCTHIGLDEQSTSAIYGIAGGIDMLVFYPAGKVMDMRGRAAVAVPSMLIMAAALVALPFAHTFAAVLAASCALGFGNGIGSGMVMTLGADFSPDVGRAPFLGLWRQLSDTGSTIGPLALSGMTALAGLSAAVVVNATFGVLAAAMLAYWPAKLMRAGWGAARPEPDAADSTPSHQR